MSLDWTSPASSSEDPDSSSSPDEPDSSSSSSSLEEAAGGGFSILSDCFGAMTKDLSFSLLLLSPSSTRFCF